MKKLLAIVMMLVIFFAMFFYGCKNSDQKDYISELTKEEAAKEVNLKIASDSIVYLSFGGLALGESATPMINKATKDKKIWDIKQNKGDGIISFKSNIFLPKQKSPLCVDVVVSTFNDSISRIFIISEDYVTHQELIDLYRSKYTDKYASSLQWSSIWGNNEFFLHENSDLWDRDANHDGRSWNFNNQSIHVINEYTIEEHIYLKDSRMKSPENRYGKSYTKYFMRVIILYNDNKLCKEAEGYKKAVNAQLKIELQNEREKEQTQQQIKASEQDI